MNHFRILSPSIFLLMLQAVTPLQAQGGKALFDKNCADCHSIGGGDGGGPDLKGVVTKRPPVWLERIIAEPDKLTAEKDLVHAALVQQFGMEMPNLGLSLDDTRSIIAFLKEGSDGTASTEKFPAAGSPEVVATPELIEAGKALFLGQQAFGNGGPPCLACHAFQHAGMQDGNLAADLTGLYARLGEQGMRAVLKGLKFPIMKKVYADRPLTEEEITALLAFSKQAAAQQSHRDRALFPVAGAVLSVIFMLGLTLFKRRIR
jgi:cytochrome c peroxidase